MDGSSKKGVSFGLTSGIITTLGLMVGLDSGTGLKSVVIGGVLTVAIADAFSDALGMHMSEESDKKNTHKKIWNATIMTFFAKLIIASSFIIPLLILNLQLAIIVNLIWGLLLLSTFNYFLAKQRNENPLKTIFNHLFIAVIVVVITYFIGELIAFYF